LTRPLHDVFWFKIAMKDSFVMSRSERPPHLLDDLCGAREFHPFVKQGVTIGGATLLERQAIDGYLFEGKRYDAGDKLGFLKATVEFALSRPDLADLFRAYLKSLDL